jgi:hypothetical protein
MSSKVLGPGIKTALVYAWRYLILAPPILLIFSLIESVYLQALLPEMAIIGLDGFHWLVLGGILNSYVENGAWCAAFGAACGALVRPSTSSRPHMAFSGIAMGCIVAGFEVARTLYERRILEDLFDPFFLALVFLAFVKGLVAGGASAYWSYGGRFLPDTAETFS